MKRWKDQSGFTLVELMVTILVSSIVMIAASSMLLMAVRMGAFGNINSTRQNNIQVFQKLLQDQQITQVTGDKIAEGDSYSSWEISGKDNLSAERVLVSYDKQKKKIYIGESSQDQVLLEDVEETTLKFENATNKCLLTITMVVDGKEYTMAFSNEGNFSDDGAGNKITSAENDGKQMEAVAAFSLTPEQAGDDSETSNFKEIPLKEAEQLSSSAISELEPSAIEKIGRKQFIERLFKQSESHGEIIKSNDNYQYYTEWYIGGYKEGSGWDENTPWCACYISWVLDDLQSMLVHTPCFADVVKGVEYFQICEEAQLGEVTHWSSGESGDAKPGDLVFFDLNDDGDPEHVGVVLAIENDKLYTIEGNVDDAVKALCYEVNDSTILGYGSLHWK